MAVVLNPPDGPVPPDNPVLHVIQVVLAEGDLLPDALLHLLQVLGVDHPPEGVARMGAEFRHGVALEHAEQCLVCVNDLLALRGVVDEKAPRHLVHEPHDVVGRPDAGGVRQGKRLRPKVHKLADPGLVGLKELQQLQNMFHKAALVVLTAHRSILSPLLELKRVI